MAHLLSELIPNAAQRDPLAPALGHSGETLNYAELAQACSTAATRILARGLDRGERVAIFLDKRIETVTAIFGTAQAGGVFVPVNPVLKAEQVGHIIRDCSVRILVTSPERLALLRDTLPTCTSLRWVLVVEGAEESTHDGSYRVASWDAGLSEPAPPQKRVIDTDLAAILYTSGSTGKPKGVMLSHRNMVAGAESVASYLENHARDRLLAVLPLSFDAGFSQLTTAFSVGACAVLMNYLLPRDVIGTLAREKITGLTAVPPLWIQLAQLEWPASVATHLRYIANTGGRMPQATLAALCAKLPHTKPYLMYGLTEAFRSTYLPPEEVERRPDSIGKAIPNAEILVLREDGSPCAANEPGELVHRGALVGMGYWNDPTKTAERYKPLPNGVGGREVGMVIPELAVFSGDTVRRDEEGFLYFVGRRDEMIKTSGYRVSPTEIEEVFYASQRVGEVAAFGVAHPALGEVIVVVATPRPGTIVAIGELKSDCQRQLPAYMQPALIDLREGVLPRNPNGKIDRKRLAAEFEGHFGEVAP